MPVLNIVICLSLRCGQGGTDKKCMQIYKKSLRKFPLGRSRKRRRVILKWFIGGKDRGDNGTGS
jgi:hypothetical protein